LEFGPRLKELQALRDAGNNIPALDRQPELDITTEWLWNAYVELDRARHYVNGVAQPVAVSEVLAYCQLTGLNREDASFLMKIVRTLERVHLERIAAKAKNARTSSRNRRKASRTGR
jgi:hypothetical protein